MGRIKYNYVIKAAFIVFATVGAAFFNFILQTLYAKNLNENDYGKLSLYLNFIMLVMPIVGAGLHNFWIKCYSKDSNDFKYWIKPSLLFLKITFIFSLFLHLLFCFFYLVDNYIVYFLISTFVVAQVAIDLINSLNIIDKDTRKYIFWRCFSPILRLFLAITFIFTEWLNLLSIGLIYFISSIFPFLYFLNKIKKCKVKENIYSVRDVFKNCWMYSVAGILYLIYLQSNLLIIPIFYDIKYVGFFNIAVLFITVVLIFPTIVFQKAFAVEINTAFYSNKNLLKNLISKTIFVMFFLGCFISLIFYFLSPVMIKYFFGERYLDSIVIVKILLFLIPFAFVITPLSSIHIRRRDLHTKVILMLLVAIFHVVLIFILKDYYGIELFAYITVFSYFLLSLLFLFSAKKLMVRELSEI